MHEFVCFGSKPFVVYGGPYERSGEVVMNNIMQDTVEALDTARSKVLAMLSLVDDDRDEAVFDVYDLFGRLDGMLSEVSSSGRNASALQEEGPVVLVDLSTDPRSWITSDYKPARTLLDPSTMSRFASQHRRLKANISADKPALTKKEYLQVLEEASPVEASVVSEQVTHSDVPVGGCC